MRRFVVVVALLCGMSAPTYALIVTVELTPDLEEVDVTLFDRRVASLYFPEPVRDWQNGNSVDFQVVLAENRADTLNISGTEGAMPTNVNIELSSGRRVTAHLRMVSARTKATDRIDFYEPGNMPDHKPGALERRLGLVASNTNHVEPPIEISWEENGFSLILRTGFTIHTDDEVLLPVCIRGRGGNPYPVKELQLLDHHGVRVDATVIHGGEVKSLHPGEEIGAVFRIANPHQVALGWSVVAIARGRLASAQFDWSARRKRGPIQGRLALSLHAFGGAGNVDDGAGNGETGWTPLQGIGARALYGLTPNLSIQGALDFTRTSTAIFTDVMWDQEQGDLQVSETAGRVLTGGVLHTAGKRWLPYVGLAVGFQFSRHEQSMSGRTEFEVRSSFLAGFGTGLNVLLSKRLLGGLSFAYVAAIGGNESATVEAGLHIGANWSLSSQY